jgi:hypothetical protein
MSDTSFLDFWQQYPKKVAKKDACKAWSKLTEAQKLKAIEALPAHCKRWEDPQYVPHAASWLRGERFEDEIQDDQHKQAPWYSTDQATLGYGNKKGLPPRPGESMAQYRDRLRAA